jgi:hypothetical protein
MNKVYNGITHIYNISIDTASKLHNMRNIIKRMKDILYKRD